MVFGSGCGGNDGGGCRWAGTLGVIRDSCARYSKDDVIQHVTQLDAIIPLLMMIMKMNSLLRSML